MNRKLKQFTEVLNSQSSIQKRSLFGLFLAILLIDRIVALVNFGFVYTDIDQTVLWNGLLDYSQGIFPEPFFYGQPYNYMLESLVAVPLYWMNIPVYIAMPMTTSFIVLLPFIVLAFLFFKTKKHFWAFLTLALPILLPVEFNFLTSLSRGFVQAFLFLPLLYIPLFYPQKKGSVTLLYITSALCFIANQSSALFIAPVFLFVFTYHYKSLLFYIKALLVLPILFLDYLAKEFYTSHSERIVHPHANVGFSLDTFWESLKTYDHFENLFPFFSSWGIVYPLLFILLAVIGYRKSLKKEALFSAAAFLMLMVTFAIPKVQERHDEADIFFTPSRLFIVLPILLIISLFMVFKKSKNAYRLTLPLLALTVVFMILKNNHLDRKIAHILDGNIFPSVKNETLVTRALHLNKIALKNDIDLIVHANMNGYEYILDSYAFNPIVYHSRKDEKKIISVNLYGDRRTWLYSSSLPSRQILLSGFKIDSNLLKPFDHEIISDEEIVIKNNNHSTQELFSRFNLEFKI
ncbi:hypothetical protein [Owenweeksia hongkongensis]|uniref:hypothetical protein n=1 Tax=Owenweeksia hongkongensis TaxID=253245 RepID=UPI003A94E449